MTGPLYEFPDSIQPRREEYRQLNAALEVALDLLDRALDADLDGSARRVIETALSTLARRIWPELGSLDDEEG